MSAAKTRFYVVAQRGSGTRFDPWRPAVPAQTDWVGLPLRDGRYLVLVRVALQPGPERTPAAAAELLRTAGYPDGLLERWKVG